MEKREPAKVLILTLVTCGIYALIWLSSVCEEINQALGREEFSFGKEIGLTFLTCGAWGIWFQWRLSEAIVEVQEKYGAQPELDAPLLFATNFVYLGPFFMQKSLNNAWDHAK